MSDLEDKIKEVTDTEDSTAQFDKTDIEKNKIMGILAYISWLVLIPIFAAKDSKFARFHVNQGLVLAIAEIICWVAFGLLKKLPLIGWLFSILYWLIQVVCLILAIMGIVNAANGKAKDLPIIGKFRIFN